MVNNMEMSKINDLVLDQNIQLYRTAKQLYEEKPSESKLVEIKQKMNQRTARKEHYAKKYLENKKDIYAKLK